MKTKWSMGWGGVNEENGLEALGWHDAPQTQGGRG